MKSKRGNKNRSKLIIGSMLILSLLIILFTILGVYVFNYSIRSGENIQPNLSPGNVYYVSVTGNDSYIGTQTLPFRTIQKCANVTVTGDSCIVQPGVYNERITTRVDNVTFRANGSVNMDGFFIQNEGITVDGFTISRYAPAPSEEALIYVAYNSSFRDGSNCRIINNKIGPSVYAKSDDFYFLNVSMTQVNVTSKKMNFTALGFRPGIQVYFASDTVDYILNHDMSASIIYVSDHLITGVNISSITASYENISYLTNTTPARPFQEDDNVTSVIYASLGRNGDYGGFTAITLDTVVSGGNISYVDNCYIANNTINDIMSGCLNVQGRNNLVERNNLNNCNGFAPINLAGRNNVIRYNYIHDCKRAIPINPRNGEVNHTAGVWWDFATYTFRFMGAANGSEFINNTIDHNFIINVENELAKFIGYDDNNSGLTFTNNVFSGEGIGVTADFSIQNEKIKNNLFYNLPNIPNIGQISQSHGTNLGIVNATVVNNGFLGVGSDLSTNSGWFGYDLNKTDVKEDYNYVSGSSPGYNKSYE